MESLVWVLWEVCVAVCEKSVRVVILSVRIFSAHALLFTPLLPLYSLGFLLISCVENWNICSDFSLS